MADFRSICLACGFSIPFPGRARVPCVNPHAYLHIPFCSGAASIADFAVVPIGDKADGAHSNSIRRYLPLLHWESAACPIQGRPSPPCTWAWHPLLAQPRSRSRPCSADWTASSAFAAGSGESA